MSNSVRPQRRQPTRLRCPWDSPGKNTGVGCRFLPQCMKVKSESEVAQSCPTLMTSWTAAYQAPLSVGFSRQEYWSGLPLPSPLEGLGHHQKHPLVPEFLQPSSALARWMGVWGHYWEKAAFCKSDQGKEPRGCFQKLFFQFTPLFYPESL